jgi:hypothetical protein
MVNLQVQPGISVTCFCGVAIGAPASGACWSPGDLGEGVCAKSLRNVTWDTANKSLLCHGVGGHQTVQRPAGQPNRSAPCPGRQFRRPARRGNGEVKDSEAHR